MTSAASLRAAGTALGDDRVLVPEYAVKALLRERGLAVPSGAVVARLEDVATQAAQLRAPLVLKAFGPSIVHKTELGAVSLGVSHDQLHAAARGMHQRLAEAGREPAGYLVEEQQQRGIELLVGVVIQEGVSVVVCGLGGTYTEALKAVAARLLPLSADDASAMLREFHGAAMLDSARAGDAADRDALRDLLLALAGPRGVAMSLLDEGLREFECNPVIVTPQGPRIADARMILDRAPRRAAAPAAPRDFTRLFKPKSIAIAGVSASGRGFGAIALESYRRFGWKENLYVVHPSASNFGETPAYRSLADVPGGGVDYLRVTLPAREAVAFVSAEAGRARVIQVITGGFGELGGESLSLEEGLLDAARRAGVPLVGPNCVGTYCPAGGQTWQLSSSRKAGTIGIVSQSGGVCNDILEIGGVRGLAFSKVVSVGNSNDVTPAEMVEYMIDDPDTAAIGMYLEDMRDRARLVRALRAARGSKPVVILASGLTRSGAVATASHTGAMATDARLLQAIGASTGAIILSSVEELIGALLAFQHHAYRAPAARDPTVLIVGHGGGHTVIAADQCERAGIEVPPLVPEAVKNLSGMNFGVQKLLVNPLELIFGPATTIESTREVLEAVLKAQPITDILLHISVRTFYSFDEGFFEHGGKSIEPLFARLRSLAAPLPGNPRIFLSARATEVAPGHDKKLLMRTAAEAGLPLYFSGEEAVRAMRAVQIFERSRA